jgi:hypothetical protein
MSHVKRCIARSVASLALLSMASSMAWSAAPPFKFESVVSLDDMTALIRSRFPLGTPGAQLRHTFVEEGQATLKRRMGDAGVEKYIYDINLCSYYVWRWNISADYDAGGLLRQAYVNGNIVHPDGTPKRVIAKVAEDGKKSSLSRLKRPRPQAFKGERELDYLLFDRDSDPSTTDDQMAMGAGPTRADPTNMGRLFVYSEVDPWRSIFDADAADQIVPYDGDCKAVEKVMEARRPPIKQK